MKSNKKEKKRISKAYWIWFQFSESDTKKLNNIKKIINNKLKGPYFQIHLTAIGPYLKLTKKDLNKIELISKKIKKFKIQLDNYKLSYQKYTSLYISVEKSKQIINVRKKFSRTNYKKQNNKYKPHISLFYGNKDIVTKKSVIKKLPKLIKFITIDKLCIVDVDEKINKWKIIKTFKLKNV
tara:strand:- start:62 stop:604 length:543 start_codon:yes stop_codon:yes gene_type:complete